MNIFTFLIDHFKRWWMDESSPHYLRGLLVSAAAMSLIDNKIALIYEQGASKKRIEQYWRRWLTWGFAGGLLALTPCVHSTPCDAFGLPSGFACVCTFSDSAYFGDWNGGNGNATSDTARGITRCLDATDLTCTITANGATTDYPTLANGTTLYFKNTTETPGETFSCTFTMGTGFVTAAHPPLTTTSTPNAAATSIYRVPFAPLPFVVVSLLGCGVITYVWRNKNKRD